MPDSWLYDTEGRAVLYQEGAQLHDAETGEALFCRDDDKVFRIEGGQLAYTISGQGLHRPGESQPALIYGLLPQGRVR